MKPKKLILLASLVIFASLLILIPTATGENPKVGEGVLYVYTDSARTTEAYYDGANYHVRLSVLYYFTIDGIDTTKEVTSPDIWIWVYYQVDGAPNKYVIFEGSTATTVDFEWVIPSDIPISTTLYILYDDAGDETPGYKAADKMLAKEPATLLVVDEAFLGSLGAVVALFSGLVVKTFLRKKKASR